MRHRRGWAFFLPIVVLITASVACGGFQVRVTPTPEVEPGEATTSEPTRVFASTLEPTAPPTTATAEPAPTGATAAPTAGSAARQARVVATGGLNVRDSASTQGKRVGNLSSGTVATVLEGPIQADNYDWYRVEATGGITGWVAAGPASEPWLRIEDQQAAPAPGATATPSAPKLVERAIKVGDQVQVTTESTQVLTVRQDAGRGARALAKVPRGTLFTVKSGPVQEDGLTWWELQSDTVNGWAAEGDGQSRWLTPLE